MPCIVGCGDRQHAQRIKKNIKNNLTERNRDEKEDNTNGDKQRNSSVNHAYQNAS